VRSAGTLHQVTGPAEALLPLDLRLVADQHLRVANGRAEDEYIQRLIRTVWRRGERISRRPFTTEVWDLVFDHGFPCGEIEIPKAPLQRVDAITYTDTAGALTTLATDRYVVTTPAGPNPQRGRVAPAYLTNWPDTRASLEAVRIRFTCGYRVNGSPSELPTELQHAMLLVISELYKSRSMSIHAVSQTPAVMNADHIFLAYRPY
jgi:uncharacterized phiE125 gp8 family phage protein